MRFLLVDRILELLPGVMVRGLKHVTHDDDCLTEDADGRFCFIPSLIGEALGQLAAWNVMQFHDFGLRPVAGVVSSAHLYRPVYVGETVLLESWIDALDDVAVEYHSVATVDEHVVFKIEGALGPLLPMMDFVDDVVVRRQFEEINRPLTTPLACSFLREASPGRSLHTTTPQPKISCCFDRLLTDEPGVSLTAQKSISRAAPYFPDHFPNKPVLPMTVLLECLLNLARTFIVRASFEGSYAVQALQKIKMNGFVYPGDVVQCTMRVKKHDAETLILQSQCTVDNKRVCVADVMVSRA